MLHGGTGGPNCTYVRSKAGTGHREKPDGKERGWKENTGRNEVTSTSPAAQQGAWPRDGKKSVENDLRTEGQLTSRWRRKEQRKSYQKFQRSQGRSAMIEDHVSTEGKRGGGGGGGGGGRVGFVVLS